MVGGLQIESILKCMPILEDQSLPHDIEILFRALGKPIAVYDPTSVEIHA